MSFIFNNEIRYADSPNIDAFGRLRTSEPENIFSSTLVIDSGRTVYETYTLSGSATYNSNSSDVSFSVNANNGARVLREQHGYNVYQPGKSQLVLLTGVFGTGVANTKKYMGYYNDNDGLMFMYSGATFGINLRTSTSGAAVEAFVPQTDWNIDTLITGSSLNPSGYHLDTTKTNIYIINFQWLGVGRVVYALDIDGIIVPVHQILNANNKTVVYMSTGSLPIRYEVSSQGGTDNTFKQICSSVISEGGQELFERVNVVSNALTTRTFATRQSVISARLSNTYAGKTNRTTIIPLKSEVFTNTATINAYWELVLTKGYLGENNLGGSPTWTGLSGTPIEYSINGTTVTGGTVIDSGFVSTTNQAGVRTTSVNFVGKDFLALNYSGGTSDWLHLVITPSASSTWGGTLTLKSKQ
jgi:hypothetical protein